MENQTTNLTQFAQDVISGLGNDPKYIPSKYFYDEEGDRIFQQIMGMPEYYLTNAEYEIFTGQAAELCSALDCGNGKFNLIEFGAGDGYKTKVLLKELLKENADFTYYPVDISRNILDELEKSLKADIPELKVMPLNMDYFGALKFMKSINQRRNITLFLGSNIGNFHIEEAEGFLRELSANCNPGDMLLLGVDLKKDKDIITTAYDDPHGITSAFNLNLLTRMNRELGSDFKLDSFEHLASYDEKSGEMKSYLVSMKGQKVVFSDIDIEVYFSKGEKIHTEISRKYDLGELESIASKDNFEVINHFTDSKNYFTDTLWRVR